MSTEHTARPLKSAGVLNKVMSEIGTIAYISRKPTPLQAIQRTRARERRPTSTDRMRCPLLTYGFVGVHSLNALNAWGYVLCIQIAVPEPKPCCVVI